MDTLSAQLMTLTLALFSVGGTGSFALKHNSQAARLWGTTFAILGSLSGMFLGAHHILGASPFVFRMDTFFPYMSIALRVDQLSGLFICILSFVAIAASIYGHSYMRHYEKEYSLASFYGFYNLFIASLILVFVADHALFFLFAWEAMALVSYFLVIFEHTKEENVRAGLVYFIMTHVATTFIVLAFFLLYQGTGSFDFAVWRESLSGISQAFLTTISLLFLVGFGTKAGMIPFHTWLPLAHPAAPSGVSALMSGVMIKTGIYMLIRMLLDVLPGTTPYIGVAVLLLGSVSALLGVLYALEESDIKRLLAYSSIENVGIMLIGLGATLSFDALGNETLALLALTATIFHLVNHSVFKSLLFLGAGSVVHATGTRNIEEYGGLIKRMPKTALYFLLGSIAIAGIIPLNGFVSEWMLFQSLMGGVTLAHVLVKTAAIGGVIVLIFTSGIAAAVAIKAFGISFLARPRSTFAVNAHEAEPPMRIAMGLLSVPVLLLAVFAGHISTLIMGVAGSLSLFRRAAISLELPKLLPSPTNAALGAHPLDMPFIVILLLLAIVLAYTLPRLMGGRRTAVSGNTWDCGYPPSPRMEMSGASFSRSIVIVFGFLLRPIFRIEKGDSVTSHVYQPNTLSVTMRIRDIYDDYLYSPIMRTTTSTARNLSKIQSGSTHVYLLYMMIVLVLLLIWTTRQLP